jgi:hypothetical protein
MFHKPVRRATPGAENVVCPHFPLLTKAERPIDDPFRTFQEWYSDADEKAYADL